VQPEAPVTKETLQELDLPKGIIIGAVLREEEVIIPDGTARLQAGDRAVVFLLSSEMSKLEAYFYPPRRGFFSELWNHRKNHRNSPHI